MRCNAMQCNVWFTFMYSKLYFDQMSRCTTRICISFENSRTLRCIHCNIDYASFIVHRIFKMKKSQHRKAYNLTFAKWSKKKKKRHKNSWGRINDHFKLKLMNATNKVRVFILLVLFLKLLLSTMKNYKTKFSQRSFALTIIYLLNGFFARFTVKSERENIKKNKCFTNKEWLKTSLKMLYTHVCKCLKRNYILENVP